MVLSNSFYKKPLIKPLVSKIIYIVFMILKIAILIYSISMIENIIIYGGVFCCGCLGGCCLIHCTQLPPINEDLEEENYILRSIYDLSPRRWRPFNFSRTNSSDNNRQNVERTPEVTPRVVVQASAPSSEIIHANAEYADEVVALNRDAICENT